MIRIYQFIKVISVAVFSLLILGGVSLYVAQNGFHVGDTSTSTKTLLRKDDVPLEPHKNIALDNTSSSTHAVASLTATEKNNIPDAKTENAVTTVRKKVASTTINLPKPIVHVSRTTTSVATGTTNLLDEGLHEDEVIALSNSERVRAGLAPLTKNSNLHAMAEAKAVDMINKQYLYPYVSASMPIVTPSGETWSKYCFHFL
jgi:hypothetical protein